MAVGLTGTIGMGPMHSGREDKRRDRTAHIGFNGRQNPPRVSYSYPAAVVFKPHLSPIQGEGNPFLLHPGPGSRRPYSQWPLSHPAQFEWCAISHIAGLDAKLLGHQ